MSTLPPGTAPIKPQYLLSTKPQAIPDDDAAEGTTSIVKSAGRGEDDSGNGQPSRRALAKAQKKARQGANKGRRFGKVRDEVELCWKVANGAICDFGTSCRFTHDIAEYIKEKPQDLRIPLLSEFKESPPYGPDLTVIGKPGKKHPNIDFSTKCPVHEESGECRYGYKCRYMGGHALEDEEGNVTLVADEDKKAQVALTSHEINFVGGDVQKQLRSKKYPTPIASAYLEELKSMNDEAQKPQAVVSETTVMETDEAQPSSTDAVASEATQNGTEPAPAEEVISKRVGGVQSGKDEPDVPMRFSEKRRLDWKGKTYLAPLTTVGNLPFRRMCVKLGADITCGEMGLATSFLAGSKEEWSLVRRHPSEKIFGIQVAGNKPHTLVPTAEVIAKEFPTGVDFVDLNCGCPIDLVFKAGSGSALLDNAGKLGKIIQGMNRALGEIPLTVKIRTGVKEGRNNAHKLMPRISAEWSASAITLHGRTRQQRYTKLADWDYIKECVAAVRAREADEDLPPVPIFGGGDCFSSQDYWEKINNYGVDGVMIGRGALIKPWIFTEIKERREWDISATERLQLIRDYVEYGLNHFGSDTAGVNTTRRYLCEALSFQYRYVPIGLLERLPAKINERAPAFVGRSDLETLLASPDSQDWVKISEMFLGPAPQSWVFTPKHKSNAYGSEEGQG
ncbi:zinc finger dihydrouridine synthase [Coprinopsis cinerea okayama7|uniref:tRNA-dihydrouridine(47) synthase [NAD(P)(+)] n=1 Tax=Coprinopsis cinerea (strain Okayama-7 / 130 / ATCC MYA-4618 / FGSC 9003) TaxID=240176 RepID=DUS3_COPC7|nr:zinc finger dihydrouridine synthase [Coprinopsis cinerea okayama7\|eukprot:XP_001837779.1 zinc finger dihydrouridine synthase [Coprinopsis cinerea okayama7\